MATVNALWTHALNAAKLASTDLSAEELRIAQFVQNEVNQYFTWKWSVASGTNITVVQTTQEYNLAAGDQNLVHAIIEAWLVSAGTAQFPLIVYDRDPVSTTATEARPYAISLISDTRVRLYPNPDAAYTLSFRYHTLGAIFALNSESFTAPGRFDNAIKAGMLWQMTSHMDETDPRIDRYKATFYELLEREKLNEIRRQHTVRV